MDVWASWLNASRASKAGIAGTNFTEYRTCRAPLNPLGSEEPSRRLNSNAWAFPYTYQLATASVSSAR